jgi:hypothetical protein
MKCQRIVPVSSPNDYFQVQLKTRSAKIGTMHGLAITAISVSSLPCSPALVLGEVVDFLPLTALAAFDELFSAIQPDWEGSHYIISGAFRTS